MKRDLKKRLLKEPLPLMRALKCTTLCPKKTHSYVKRPTKETSGRRFAGDLHT